MDVVDSFLSPFFSSAYLLSFSRIYEDFLVYPQALDKNILCGKACEANGDKGNNFKKKKLFHFMQSFYPHPIITLLILIFC